MAVQTTHRCRREHPGHDRAHVQLGIYTHEGRMIREASAGNDVEQAKAQADAWLRGEQ
ncbi:hypothetical protein ACQPZ2_30205 [Nocardia pseudovaccinii]|uniref:hypothetical protein n=1 Tax=Nocardia pseudovaccinii TaxID=189540 RepID=UPI003D950790